jgi:hypothetical protein
MASSTSSAVGRFADTRRPSGGRVRPPVGVVGWARRSGSVVAMLVVDSFEAQAIVIGSTGRA